MDIWEDGPRLGLKRDCQVYGFRGAFTGFSRVEPDPLYFEKVDPGRGLSCGARSVTTSGKFSMFTLGIFGDIGDATVAAERLGSE